MLLVAIMSSMLLLLCASWFTFASAMSATPYALEDAEIHFEHFIKEYGRNYAHEYEKQARFKIFKENLETINHLNKKSKTAVYGITKFSDLFPEEFKKFTGLGSLPDSKVGLGFWGCKDVTDADIHDNDAPESFDWRDKNVVTRVKDQMKCGCCYAFSATGNIEGQYALKYKKLVELSEQQILDCDDSNSGCYSGDTNVAMSWLMKQGGIMSEADYPYLGKMDFCHFNASKVQVKITDCFNYNLTSQEKVKQLLYQKGPISIAVQGDPLQHYKGGIISDDECYAGVLNHIVLLVGYGSENGNPFWIVKNSWAEAFGEKGYYRMNRGEGAHSCGMMNINMASSTVA